jgi:hypothetical protein
MKARNWLLLLLVNVIPVVLVHLIARAFWSEDKVNTSIALFEIVFTMLILPFLLLFNYSFESIRNMNKFGVWILLVFTLGLSTVLGFKNWADTVGSWTHPDTETLAVNELKFSVGFVIVSVITLVTMVRANRRERSIQTP